MLSLGILLVISNKQLAISFQQEGQVTYCLLLIARFYSTTSDTVPAPTVRPPSRIAHPSPFSLALGAIKVISSWMLSPGITISTPAGRFATPVTSVVRK